MNHAMTDRLIRFQHPEKVLGYLGRLDDDRLAALFGLEPEVYRRVRRDFAERARGAAAELLDDHEFAATVDRLPFARGAHVLAIGESTTGDLLSWFEILRHLVELRRPSDGLRLTNLAVSGQTSTQALTTLPGPAALRPDWVLCMLGGNDAQRLGSADGPTLVSLTETERNLRILHGVATARWLWLTPTTVDERRVANYQPFQRAGITWTNHDLRAVGRIVTALPGHTLDTQPVAARHRGEPFHLDDGVHLSLAGQQSVAGAVVDALTR